MNKEIQNLSRLAHELAKHAETVNHPGLYDGKMGIVIFLYHYARHFNDSSYTKLADQLLDDVLTNLPQTPYFNNGFTGIAWSICHLMDNQFIDGDIDEILGDIDDAIWDPKNEYFRDFQFMFDVGIYMSRRININKYNHTWYERATSYLRKLREIFILRYVSYALPIYSCRGLYSVFQCCDPWLQNGHFIQEIQLVYNELPLLTQMAYQTDQDISGKYILYQLLINSENSIDDRLKKGIHPPEWGELNLCDIGSFYWSQLIFNHQIPVPSIFNQTIPSMMFNDTYIQELLSFLKLHHINMNQNITGLAWFFLQWQMKLCNM